MSAAPARLATDGAEAPTIALRGVSRVYGQGRVDGARARRHRLHDRTRRVRPRSWARAARASRRASTSWAASTGRPAASISFKASTSRGSRALSVRCCAATHRLHLSGVQPAERTTALENVELPLIYRRVPRSRAPSARARDARAGRPRTVARNTRRQSYRAANSNGSRSRARWSRIPPSCSRTSRPATSTPRAATKS